MKKLYPQSCTPHFMSHKIVQVAFFSLSRTLANHVLCVAVLFCMKYSLTEEFRSVSLYLITTVCHHSLLLGRWSHGLLSC